MRVPFGERLAAVGDTALISNARLAVAGFSRRLVSGLIDGPAYALKLGAAIREFRPSVIHSNGIKMHLLAAVVRGRAPIVWHIRDLIGARPLVSRAMRLLEGRASAAIAISNSVAADARNVLSSLPISVVYDAIDTDVFAPSGPSADLDSLSKCPAAAGVLRVGLVATYARWKGHDVFLKAIARLKSRHPAPAARFYVVGGPIYETAASQYDERELRALAAELGVEGRVGFVPFQERIDEVYRSLDVVVHASLRPEPFGRTIAEGMASGKPTIVSHNSGAGELLMNGMDAIQTPAGSDEALAAAIEELAGDAGLRERMGRAARRTAVDRFSRGRLAEEVFRVYRGVNVEV
jgi:glycosyltransferase involved in cell wall biosynthesis